MLINFYEEKRFESIKHVILQQEVDQLEWCLPMCPFPSKIGCPGIPCDLKNIYNLYETDEFLNIIDDSDRLLEFKEISTLRQRLLCFPSLREFQVIGKDTTTHQTQIQIEKIQKIPFFSEGGQEIKIKYLGQYIGKVVEPQSFTYSKGLYSELDIYNHENRLLYKIQAKLNQPGICCILPFNKFKQIHFQVFSNQYSLEDDEGILTEVDGFIKHVFYGCLIEYSSKADQYAIQFPSDAKVQDKILLISAALFIDYLYFENC